METELICDISDGMKGEMLRHSPNADKVFGRGVGLNRAEIIFRGV